MMSEPPVAEATHDADDAMDELIRQEIEAAFAGLEESFANGEDDQALELIQSQGKQVLGKVLARLEEDGQLLSAQLTERLESLASDQTMEMMKRQEERLGKLQEANLQARDDLRSELQNLQTLSKDYEELKASGLGGSSAFSRNSIVSGAAFLVGISGVGAAANEGLAMALGAGGDLPTLASNALLGAAGVGYHLYRKQSD